MFLSEMNSDFVIHLTPTSVFLSERMPVFLRFLDTASIQFRFISISILWIMLSCGSL